MRNKYNANFHEENKYYNTNQNNLDESNLDNNRGKKHNRISTPISEVEVSSEFDENKEEYRSTLQAGQKYYNNTEDSKQQKTI